MPALTSSPVIFAKTLGSRQAAHLDRTYASPRAAGRYVIHYTSTASDPDAVPALDVESLTASGWMAGADGVSDYVQWAAAALDSVIPYIAQTLGYAFNGAVLRVYMHNLGNVYGYAIPGTDSLELDNDMSFLPLSGSVTRKQGYEVTVAHEFFHRIQFGYTENINFFNEASAAWMEDEVYPDVNDYIQYVESPSSLLLKPEVPLDGAGTQDYDRLIWAKFLDERYGAVVNRRAWEIYGSGINGTREVFTRALQYLDPLLTFPEAFSEFGRWIFYTGERSAYADTTFGDAALWPAVSVGTADISTFIEGAMDTLLPLSLQYHLLQGRVDGQDVGFTVASNTDSMVYFSAELRSLPIQNISESLLVTPASLAYLSGWSSSQHYSEYYGVFNPNSDQKRLTGMTSDSIFLFQTGDSVVRDTCGFRLVKIFLDSVTYRLKDSTGQPDTAGTRLFTLLYTSGASITRELGLGSYNHLYRVAVSPVLDSLITAGTLSLRFEFIDTTGASRQFTLMAFDSVSLAGVTFDWTGQNRVLAYGKVRTVANAAGEKVFFIGLKDVFEARAFPNPVYSDQDLFSVVDNSKSETSVCRIYTLSGALVRELKAGRVAESVRTGASVSSQRLFLWDLRNGAGRRVVPGIYLYYLSGGRGMVSERGKFAVLGKKRG
ncbi:MAG: hypothetical protein V1913_01700 [Fibrobacterota bacterium]